MHAKRHHIAVMPNLTIRNVPEELHATLKRRAKANRRSLNQEVIAELSSVDADGETEEARIERSRERVRLANEKIDEMRSKMKCFMTTDEIDAAIREGRR